MGVGQVEQKWVEARLRKRGVKRGMQERNKVSGVQARVSGSETKQDMASRSK